MTRGSALKAQEILDHAPKARVHYIALLGKQLRNTFAVVLQPRLLALHREAHNGFLPNDPDFIHHTAEVWVRLGIVNNEAGVDVIGGFRALYGNGMGMAANAFTGLIKRNIVFCVEFTGRSKARDTATNNCNFQGSNLL